MAGQQVRFEDGAAYERMMGVWSRLVGTIFLDWLRPCSGMRWIDVGCGGGAFTELIVERYAPTEVQGIDPSVGQLTFARSRSAGRKTKYHQGDAMALPFSEQLFDAAVMALVIFFIPDPAKGVAEMARVVRPGGMVAAYAWDILGDGLPMKPIQVGMKEMGLTPPLPPSSNAARLDTLRKLWKDAGLEAVETREIAVQRTFANFDDFWVTCLLGGGLGRVVAAMTPVDVESLKARVRELVHTNRDGHILAYARANAVRGYIPK